MKFKLNLSERFEIFNLLPTQDNYSTLRIARKVSKDLGVTDAEYKEFDIESKVIDGRNVTSWNVEKAEGEKEFEIGEIATQLIITALKELDEIKKLEQRHYSLFEKFIDKH